MDHTVRLTALDLDVVLVDDEHPGDLARVVLLKGEQTRSSLGQVGGRPTLGKRSRKKQAVANATLRRIDASDATWELVDGWIAIDIPASEFGPLGLAGLVDADDDLVVAATALGLEVPVRASAFVPSAPDGVRVVLLLSRSDEDGWRWRPLIGAHFEHADFTADDYDVDTIQELLAGVLQTGDSGGTGELNRDLAITVPAVGSDFGRELGQKSWSLPVRGTCLLPVGATSQLLVQPDRIEVDPETGTFRLSEGDLAVAPEHTVRWSGTTGSPGFEQTKAEGALVLEPVAPPPLRRLVVAPTTLHPVALGAGAVVRTEEELQKHPPTRPFDVVVAVTGEQGRVPEGAETAGKALVTLRIPTSDGASAEAANTLAAALRTLTERADPPSLWIRTTEGWLQCSADPDTVVDFGESLFGETRATEIGPWVGATDEGTSCRLFLDNCGAKVLTLQGADWTLEVRDPAMALTMASASYYGQGWNQPEPRLPPSDGAGTHAQPLALLSPALVDRSADGAPLVRFTATLGPGLGLVPSGGVVTVWRALEDHPLDTPVEWAANDPGRSIGVSALRGLLPLQFDASPALRPASAAFRCDEPAVSPRVVPPASREHQPSGTFVRATSASSSPRRQMASPWHSAMRWPLSIRHIGRWHPAWSPRRPMGRLHLVRRWRRPGFRGPTPAIRRRWASTHLPIFRRTSPTSARSLR